MFLCALPENQNLRLFCGWMWLVPSRGLDSLSGKSKSPGSVSLPLEGVILSLQDLIFYFRPPEEELEHEEKQTKLRSLRNRQNLFQEEVMSSSLPTRLPHKKQQMQTSILQ